MRNLRPPARLESGAAVHLLRDTTSLRHQQDRCRQSICRPVKSGREPNSLRRHRTWFATVYVFSETLNGMPGPVCGKNDLLAIRHPASSVPILLKVAWVHLPGRACSSRQQQQMRIGNNRGRPFSIRRSTGPPFLGPVESEAIRACLAPRRYRLIQTQLPLRRRAQCCRHWRYRLGPTSPAMRPLSPWSSRRPEPSFRLVVHRG